MTPLMHFPDSAPAFSDLDDAFALVCSPATALEHPLALGLAAFCAGYLLGAAATWFVLRLAERRRPAAEAFASEENPFC